MPFILSLADVGGCSLERSNVITFTTLVKEEYDDRFCHFAHFNGLFEKTEERTSKLDFFWLDDMI
jgi:hypothetical protein